LISSDFFFTTKFNSFTNRNFHQYLHSRSVSKYFTDGLTNENNPLEKLLSIIFGMSVINIPMNLQTDKVWQKEITCSIPSEFSFGSLPYNRQNTVCNSVSVFLCPSVNITYHQQNIICNFIRELIVAVVFVVIIFQLSEIYRRKCSIGNPLVMI
jgi:hypothetical protein